MRKTLRILMNVALAAGASGAGTFTFLYIRKPATAPPPNVVIRPTPERLARGAYLYNLANCDGCHGERDFTRFGGPAVPGRSGAGSVFPDGLGLPGRVAAPNITPDRQTGIGTWTDGEKIRAIRDGVDKDGRPLFPMMPYESFRKMSDEDVFSLVAYLNALPPVRHAVPPARLDLGVSLMMKNVPKPAGRVPHPDLNSKRARGEYLVAIGGCRRCHSEAFSGVNRFRYAPAMEVVSANITPDLTTGIGRWSEQDFVDKFAQYRDYVEHGSPKGAGPESFTNMPWLNLCRLPDDDLRAIYAYMRALPPVFQPLETRPGYLRSGQAGR